ncbi:hypothetical protein C0995_012760 [Termitomyces sp. Mi166|nr:hypothetical protein C0995_012760 [Termitomyces sp. Mi166\
MFKAGDAQLAVSFFLKSRSALIFEEVVNEDCPEPPNPESIHQPMLVDLKREESVSTPSNPLSSQANTIPSYAIPLEQLPQSENNTAQLQNNTISLSTPSPTFSKPNIAFPKPCSCSPLPPHSFPPNIPQNRPTPTKDTQNSPPPELLDGLDIRIISAAPFAQIIWEDAQAYQLHVSPFLLKEHL